MPTPFAPDASADDHFMANLTAEERVDYWNAGPDNVLIPGEVYLATFRTDVGDIVVELLSDTAPNNVNNFIALANAGYYDGTHFYQVIEELVAIGGDPLENGSGTPGYKVADELAMDVFDAAGWFGQRPIRSRQQCGPVLLHAWARRPGWPIVSRRSDA